MGVTVRLFCFCSGRSSLEGVLKKLGKPEGNPRPAGNPVGKPSPVGKLEGKPNPLQDETFLAAVGGTEASCKPTGSGSGAGLADTAGRTTFEEKLIEAKKYKTHLSHILTSRQH